MAKKKAKTSPYDSAEYLDSAEAINAYMEEALETDDPAFIARALGTAVCRRQDARRHTSLDGQIMSNRYSSCLPVTGRTVLPLLSNVASSA